MIAAVVVAVVAAGFAARVVAVPRSRTTSDLFTAIQPPGVLLVATGLAAEHFTGVGLVLALAGGWADGPSALWPVVALTAGTLVLAVVVAGPARRAGLGGPADVARVRWGDDRLEAWLHAAAALVAAAFLVPVLQVAMAALCALAPVSPPVAVGLAALVVAAAVLVLGGRGSLYTQQLRLGAMVAAVGAAAVLAVRGSPIPLVSGTGGAGGVGSAPLLAGPPDPGPSLVGAALVLVAGSAVLPHLWPRLQAAATAEEARRAVGVGGALVAGVGLGALAAGDLAGRAGAVAAAPVPRAIDRVAAGLVLAGVLSGCLAAASSSTLAAAASLRRLRSLVTDRSTAHRRAVPRTPVTTRPAHRSDLPRAEPAPPATVTIGDRDGPPLRDGPRLPATMAPVLIPVVGAAVVALATREAGLLLSLVWAHGLGAAGLGPAVVSGLWLRSASTSGVRAGVLVGLGSSVILAAVLLPAAATGALRPETTVTPLPVVVALSAGAVAVGSRWFPDRRSRPIPEREAGALLRFHDPNRAVSGAGPSMPGTA